MTVRPCLRLWLPMGNAILLIAIVETVGLVRSEMKDVGIFIYQGLAIHSVEISEFYGTPELIFFTIMIFLQLVATIGALWIGTVLKGNKGCLLAWIVLTILSSICLIISLLINTISTPHPLDSKHAWSIAYSFVIFVLFNGYTLVLMCAGYQAMSRQESLHPIGKGARHIWDYFCNETKIAATFFLASEIVMDSEYLISRQFIQFFGIPLLGHEGDPYPPIVTEELILRSIRVFVNALGVWLVQKEKRRLFRFWCVFTSILILISTTIFIILTVRWRGEDIGTTLAYFLMFPGHLLYRFLTLFFCLKFTRADFSRFVL